MDGYDGLAYLDWWANQSTNLGGAEIRLAATATSGGGWDARATLADRGESEGVGFVRELDNWFTLRFPDGSEFAVTISEPDSDGMFTLAEADGAPGHRPVSIGVPLTRVNAPAGTGRTPERSTGR